MATPVSAQRASAVVLAATFTLQTISSYIYYLSPTLAPELASSAGEPPEFIGWLVSFGTAGSMLFLLAGTPILQRLGPLRSMQAGAVVSGLGATLLLVPTVWTTILANLLIGLGYAPALPAGSELLRNFSPQQHRNLLFSIRQASVPISGLAAGLILPLVYLSGGWPLVVATTIAVVAVGVFAVQPIRSWTDNSVPRAPLRASDLVASENLIAPLVAISQRPLLALSLTGACLGAGQGCWTAYLVTWLDQSGLSLVQAGAVFSVMQAGGVIGRLVAGWSSDRIGSAIPTLAMATIGSTIASIFGALGSDAASLPSLLYPFAAIAGVLVSSWNGVLVAAVAAKAPPGKTALCVSGLTIVAYAGFLIGPAVFALVLGATSSFRTAFGVTAILTSLGLVCLGFAGARGWRDGRR